MTIVLTVFGEPASKANSRRIVRVGGKIRSIKSSKALSYAEFASLQVRKLPELLTGRLAIGICIYYRSERPDLDESLILDVLQGKIYKNDRQIREKHIYHRIDRKNPRAEISICAIDE